MCRSHADGGRLCPSQTDPKLIANRNARRRAAYAKKKQSGSVLGDTGARVHHAAQTVERNHSLFDYKPKEIDSVLYKSVDSRESELGVTSTSYEGYLVEKGYISKTQNSGLINYTKLNDESYKEFGFQEISETRRNNISLEELMSISTAELKDIPLAERQALRFFTSNEYSWVNKALYNQATSIYDPSPILRPETEEYTEWFDGKPYSDSNEYDPYPDGVESHEKVPSFVEEITTKIDAAMDKAPNQQRIVYRGMGINHQAFDAYQKEEGSEAGGVRKFVEENYSLGQEVKFDGYQSTSVSPVIGAGYASGNGILFEIKTSSGLNASSISHYDVEQEVVLPRDSRFMVVGVHDSVSFKYSENGKHNGQTKLHVVQLVEITDDGYIRDETNGVPATPIDKTKLAVREAK